MKISKEKILLICILLTGIAARIIKFDDPSIVMDTVAFSRLGKNLIETGRYVFGENYNMGVFFPKARTNDNMITSKRKITKEF